MDTLKAEIKESISNYVNGKNFLPCSKEELVNHFSSYYDKDIVNEIILEMLNDYELVATSRKNIQPARYSGIFTGIVTGVNDDYIFVKIAGFDDDFRVTRKPYEIIFLKVN